jgi:hypothetical protein
MSSCTKNRIINKLCADCGISNIFTNRIRCLVCSKKISDQCSIKRKLKILNKECIFCKNKAVENRRLCKICSVRSVLTRKVRDRRLREEAIVAYGGFCKCCGENQKEFLHFDHVLGLQGGKRKLGGDLYSYLKKNKYPDTFQLLCANCNLAKSIYKECPHQKNSKQVFKMVAQ